jgi:plastocyanin
MKTGSFRRGAIAATLTLAVAAVGVGSAAAAVVRTAGGPDMEPNGFITDTVHFAPGAITVRPNELVTWRDRDRSPEPHTVTVVNRREQPRNIGQVFQCFGGGGPCALANAHLADPNNPESDVARTRVEVGTAGMNTRGDSLYLAPGRSISARVTATLGRTLYYFCAIHPWMQGSIRVTAASGRGGAGAALAGRHH